ncbi:sulfite oxidase [Pararoseomonas indoligenes]|uniref:Sulfite oxidase n=1 Tax=Roseomonas indoligenes TaxID=2820811 RepID=A0A940MWN9_9PROT|nr:sulfite oxidase [Pararoseomonas indoligenes]MBP0492572.1 sulfite oxidase [Pararoseomonas indoligenes]
MDAAQGAPARNETLLRAGKENLAVLPDEALNAETPLALLDAPITPVSRFFVRNNGALPSPETRAGWTLAVDGAVERPMALSIEDLRTRFEVVSLTSVLECAGNSRHGFKQPVDGLSWAEGAVGCARWTGVRLRDVLHAAGIRPEAVYTAHFSPDRAVGGEGDALSRGLPLWKALAPETLLAFAMNDAPLTFLHGAPLRIVAPGFPGSAWQKWLSRIALRDRVHDGAKMTGYDYRLPSRPVAPGEWPPPEEMAVIEDMPVKSHILSPAEGTALRRGQPATVRGHAWSGHVPLAAVDVSTDGGANWQPAGLGQQEGAFGWAPFTLNWMPERAGECRILARARDARGRAQPIDPPWNPKGYANNACHAVTVTVAAD